MRKSFDKAVEWVWDKAYDWAYGAYKVNWLFVLYFGVCVPAMLILTYFLVKGCNSGH